MEVSSAIEEFDFLNWDASPAEEMTNCMLQYDEKAPLEVCKTESGAYQVFLKPAKSRDDQYEASFPPTLLCTPYKYDLKLVGAFDKEMSVKNVCMELVDSESLSKPENPEARPGVTLEGIENHGEKEKVFRFALNWCSFHFKKRAFCLKLSYKDATLFTSTPFHTYARRRDTPYSNTACKRQLTYPAAFAFSPSRVKVQPVTPAMVSPPVSYSPVHLQTGAYPMFDFMKAPSFFQYSPASTATTISPPSSRQSSPIPTVVNSPTQPAAGQIPQLFASMERTQMAIQLLSSLSPAERDAVNYYLSCQSGR